MIFPFPSGAMQRLQYRRVLGRGLLREALTECHKAQYLAAVIIYRLPFPERSIVVPGED